MRNTARADVHKSYIKFTVCVHVASLDKIFPIPITRYDVADANFIGNTQIAEFDDVGELTPHCSKRKDDKYVFM